MQVGDATAEFGVADCKSCGSDGGAAEKFEMEVDGVWLGAGWMCALHVGASADEEGRGGVATVRDGTDAPGIFQDEGVGVRGNGGDGEDIGEGGGSHGGLRADWRWDGDGMGIWVGIGKQIGHRILGVRTLSRKGRH